MYTTLALASGFICLFDLTLFLSISVSPFLLASILIYVALCPILALFRRKYIYYAILPVPYLGSWLISVFYLSTSHMPILQTSLVTSIIPTLAVTILHMTSRNRNMLGRWPMTSLGRVWSSAASAIFIGAAPYVLGVTTGGAQTTSGIMYYVALLLAYSMSSMLYVNSAYRYRVMCQSLRVSNLDSRMIDIWRKIGERFSGKEGDVDLLRYYFTESVRLFEEGDYETAFLSGYKVISEVTVANPKDFVKSEREDPKLSFSDIRTTLMHSRRKDIQIDIGKIREKRRNLPKYCVEVLQRGYEFLQRITS